MPFVRAAILVDKNAAVRAMASGPLFPPLQYSKKKSQKSGRDGGDMGGPGSCCCLCFGWMRSALCSLQLPGRAPRGRGQDMDRLWSTHRCAVTAAHCHLVPVTPHAPHRQMHPCPTPSPSPSLSKGQSGHRGPCFPSCRHGPVPFRLAGTSHIDTFYKPSRCLHCINRHPSRSLRL